MRMSQEKMMTFSTGRSKNQFLFIEIRSQISFANSWVKTPEVLRILGIPLAVPLTNSQFQ